MPEPGRGACPERSVGSARGVTVGQLHHGPTRAGEHHMERLVGDARLVRPLRKTVVAIETAHGLHATLARPAGVLLRFQLDHGCQQASSSRNSSSDNGHLLWGRIRLDRDHEGRCVLAHRGIFPCLRRGVATRLDRANARERISHGLVVRGSITSSMYPREAAW